MVIDLLNKKEQSNVFNLFETKIPDLGPQVGYCIALR